MRSLEGLNLGNYRLIEQVGIGGMAVVYKAYDPALDRYVAIKLLPEYLGHDEEFSARFRAEARNVARLRHPNILSIYGYGEENGLSYFVMELIEGGTLKDLMGEPVDPQRAVSLIGQVADALNYAHEQGIVHRDVKPANVLMSRPDWPVLSDFGIARVLEQSASLTRSGSAFLGTPHYMAPEQARGEMVSPKTDQYALGIVLYEMLTGTPPFHADTPQAVVYQHIYASMPLPRERNPNIPEAMERVILKALAKAPEDRFPTMAAFAAAAQAAASGAGTTLARPTLEVVAAAGADEARESIAEVATDGSVTATSETRPAEGPAGRADPTESPGPSTERISRDDITPVVRTIEGPPEEPSGRRFRLPIRRRPPSGPLPDQESPVPTLGRWRVPALGGFAAIAAIVAILALFRTFNAAPAPVAVIVFAPAAATLPQLTIAASADNSTVQQVTPNAARASLSLKPGRYVIHFPSDSRYRMDVPLAVGSSQEVVRLGRLFSLLRLLVPAGRAPEVVVHKPDGQTVADLSQDDTQRGVWLLNGRYRLEFSSGSGYNGQIPVILRSRRAPVDLAGRMAYIRIVAAPHAPFQGADVSNAAGSYQFSLPSTVDPARQPQAFPPGRYLITFGGTGSYLDPLPVEARAGSHVVLSLARAYSYVKVIPPQGGPLADFEIHDARTGKWLHNITGLAAEQGGYVLPGRYLIDPSGSNVYLDPVTVTIGAGESLVVDLGRLYGHVSVKPFLHETLPTFDIQNAIGSTTYHSNIDTRSAGTGVYVLPRAYTFSPNSSAYLTPFHAAIRVAGGNLLDLARFYGGLKVLAASGAPLDSYDIRDIASGRTLYTIYAPNLQRSVFLHPGRYAIVPDTSSSVAKYLDPVPMSVPGGSDRSLDPQRAYARLRLPAVSSQVSLSYSWNDPAGHTIQNLNAGSKAQVVFIRPGDYRVEVSRNGNPGRVVVVRALAGHVVRLPER